MARVNLTLPEAYKHALSAYNKGALREAESLCNQIIAVKRDFFDALHLLAVIQMQSGRLDEGIANFDRALTIQPHNTKVLNNKGLALHDLKRFDDAMITFDRALALQPDFTEAFNNRSITLQELKRLDEALADCERALALQPNYVDALNNRGLTLHKLNRFDEALASYEHALALQPNNAEVLYNFGNLLLQLKRCDEALASFRRTIALNPNHAKARWNEANVLLLTGDFARGWAGYEWRWKADASASPKRDFAQQLWRGADALEGKTVLLHSEQGLGDTIQFCRYAPLVAARGARVILEVERPLRELMTSLAGVTELPVKSEPLPPYDLHCPLLSLPLVFDTRIETIPSAIPYLRAPPQALRNWETQLGPRRRSRIGLAWSGNPVHKNDENRSIALPTLLPLLDIEATFVSLQKDVRAGDTETLKERTDILDYRDALNDFSDTAALISHLDLVISVDTSVAHLAGALGKPVWILLPFVPDWRWLLDRDDSPWYPTARLFRQDETRAWDGVINRVHAALCDFVNYLSR